LEGPSPPRSPRLVKENRNRSYRSYNCKKVEIIEVENNVCDGYHEEEAGVQRKSRQDYATDVDETLQYRHVNLLFQNVSSELVLRHDAQSQKLLQMMNRNTRAVEAERVLNLTYSPRFLVFEKIEVNP